MGSKTPQLPSDPLAAVLCSQGLNIYCELCGTAEVWPPASRDSIAEE